MPFELDHLLICTDEGAPAAELLVQVGLTEGSGNVHPGQGTANRRFFFHNLMLELLWVQDAAEAQSEVTRPTHLWEPLERAQPSMSEELEAIINTRLIDIQTGATYLIELSFDGESQAQQQDFRPDLPLVFHW